MTCPICKKLHMQLVGVQFANITPSAQDRLRAVVEEALADETGCTIKVIEADTNGLIMCHAYLDDKGNPQAVHQAHCAGTIPGVPKCRYFVGDQPNASTIAWCSFKTKAERAKERANAHTAQAAIRQLADDRMAQLSAEAAEYAASQRQEFNRIHPPRCVDIAVG